MKCHIRVIKQECGSFVIVGRRCDGRTLKAVAADATEARVRRDAIIAMFEILPRRQRAA